MNKKGFTLIELLAVLAILAVIASVATININSQIKKSEEQTKNILSNKIENAAKLYAGKYHASDVVRGSSDISFTIKDLVDDELLYLKDGECTNKMNSSISVGTDGTFNYNAVKASDCYKE